MDIFPVYYFPPVAWFAAAAQSQTLVLEQWIHYRKQHFYNRTSIKTPDKVLHLSIPIRKDNDLTPLHERKISYDWRWQHDHWKSLESAYRRAPYFEYFEDDIRAFFEMQTDSLLEHNINILRTISGLLDLELSWNLSDAYHPEAHYRHDLRHAFLTKTEDMPLGFHPQSYIQVFGDDFVPNLSILDLLFNKGPESLGILKAGWKWNVEQHS